MPTKDDYSSSKYVSKYLPQHHKYEILPPQGSVCLLKTDPLAFQVELPPKTASRVASGIAHEWQDGAWMEARKNWN